MDRLDYTKNDEDGKVPSFAEQAKRMKNDGIDINEYIRSK